MHIKYSLPLLACVSTLSAASPVDLQGRTTQAGPSSLKRDPSPLNPLLVTGSTLLGAGSLGTAAYLLSKMKEAQDFVDVSGEEAFVSKLASLENRDLSSNFKRDPFGGKDLVAAGVTLSTAAALAAVGLYKTFHNKEAEDKFWDSDEGKAFVSKLASFEKRDEEESTSLSERDPLNPVAAKVAATFAGGALGAAGLGGLGYAFHQSLEAKLKAGHPQRRDGPSATGVDDGYCWAYQEGLAAGEKVANIWAKAKSLFSKRDPLALNSLVGADERKEAQDFIDLYGEEAFVSKLASFIEAGDLSAISKRAHPSDKFLFPAATVAFLASAFAGYESIKKEAEDLSVSVSPTFERREVEDEDFLKLLGF